MTLTRSRSARGLLALGLAFALAASVLTTAQASSHREAPLISEDPVADSTDTYAFVSPDDASTVTLVHNVYPLQLPSGGPNFYNFGEDVLYNIHVDNDGDAIADVTYEWRFTTTIVNPDTFLYNTGPITVEDGDYSDTFNLRQHYTLSVVDDGVRTVLGQDLPVPPNNIGPRSTPNYSELADLAIAEVGEGVTSFAGQRDDPFWVDLGSIFDLGGLRPLNDLHLIPLAPEPGVDAVAGKNVLSMVLQVPIDQLVEGDEPVIGVWSTTARRKTRVFAAGNSADPVHSGPFTQVSRLGMPLVNEVVIPLGLKDVFNTLSPHQDAGALSVPDDGSGVTIPLVQDPELGRLIELLYPGVEVPPAPRNDLVAIFLTGLGEEQLGTNLNQFSGAFQPAEYIRLNTSVAPSGGGDINAQNRLGLLGGETDGFPNGRRLGDDVVDISLLAVAGATPLAPEEFRDAPNSAITQGVPTNDVEFLTTFPYVAAPFAGYDVP